MLYLVVFIDYNKGYFFGEDSRIFNDYAQAEAYAERLTNILAKTEGYPEEMGARYEVVKVRRAF